MVSHKMEEGEQFGFYLYDVKNETNYLSDIEASYSRRTIYRRGRRNASVNASELANEENASDEKKLEDGIDGIASQQAVKTDAGRSVRREARVYRCGRRLCDAYGRMKTL